MYDFVRQFAPNSFEYIKLSNFCDVLNTMAKYYEKDTLSFSVRTVYFDYSQKLMWTTIICTDTKNASCLATWQAISSPREMEILQLGSETEQLELVRKILLR